MLAAAQCPECGGATLVESGEHVCTECGLVVRQKLDPGKDCRAFCREEWERRTRTGPPLSSLYHDLGLGSTFAGRDIPPASRRFLRLRALHDEARREKSRTLITALQEVRRIGSQLELPRDTLEITAWLVKKAITAGLQKGYGTAQLAAAALLITCRQGKLRRRCDEIAAAANISTKHLLRAARAIRRELNIRNPPPTRPEDLLGAIASRLQLEHSVVSSAEQMLKKLRAKGVSFPGCKPAGIAAAALYLTARISMIPLTQHRTAEAAGISQPTLRTWSKKLALMLEPGEILPAT